MLPTRWFLDKPLPFRRGSGALAGSSDVLFVRKALSDWLMALRIK
jgi:hypothetical protein